MPASTKAFNRIKKINGEQIRIESRAFKRQALFTQDHKTDHWNVTQLVSSNEKSTMQNKKWCENLYQQF